MVLESLPPENTSLDLLRHKMKLRQIQGFIIPHADEYQGEYLPKCNERLAWLTGFTGSAGTAIVLEDKAAVFVDGRYTLQVKEEVDNAAFEIASIEGGQIGKWIIANLLTGASLAYDPNLHTVNQVKRLKTACHKAGGTLAALKDNPLDAVWSTRPPLPASPFVAHNVTYAGESSFQKRQKISEILVKEGLSAAVLTAPESVAWLLNIRGADIPFSPVALAFAIIRPHGDVNLFVDPTRLPEGIGQHLGDGVILSSPEGFAAALDQLGTGGGAVRLNPDGPSAWIYERLKVAGANIALGDDPCAMVKACKNSTELTGARTAHMRDGVALVRFFSWLSRQTLGSQLTELVAAKKMNDFRALGDLYQGPSFSTISAAGSNAAIVHYSVDEKSNRLLEAGSLFLIDSGGQYLDGTTDVTRTVSLGESKGEMRINFTRVLKGHIALASARFPEGTTGSQLDVLARKSLWDAGLDYNHGTGHGVGSYANVHEGPQKISKVPNSVPLKPGMVLSNEPGYYKPGAYGIRIENLMAVTSVAAPQNGEKEMLGFETLTLAPIDIALVDKSLLSAGEAVWLDAYHARVHQKLKSFLNDEDAEWLELATLPIGWV